MPLTALFAKKKKSRTISAIQVCIIKQNPTAALFEMYPKRAVSSQ